MTSPAECAIETAYRGMREAIGPGRMRALADADACPFDALPQRGFDGAPERAEEGRAHAERGASWSRRFGLGVGRASPAEMAEGAEKRARRLLSKVLHEPESEVVVLTHGERARCPTRVGHRSAHLPRACAPF